MTEEFWAQWKKKKDASGQNPMLLGVSKEEDNKYNLIKNYNQVLKRID